MSSPPHCLRFIRCGLCILCLNEHFAKLCGRKSTKQLGAIDGEDMRGNKRVDLWSRRAPSQASSSLALDEPPPPVMMIRPTRHETSLRGVSLQVGSPCPKGDRHHHELGRTPHARIKSRFEDDKFWSRRRRARFLPLLCGRHPRRAALPPHASFAAPPPEPSIKQGGIEETNHGNNPK
jgi:hypothetical protein